MGTKETIWYLMDRNQLKYAVEGSELGKRFLSRYIGRSETYLDTVLKHKSNSVYMTEEVASKLLTKIGAKKEDFVKEVCTGHGKKKPSPRYNGPGDQKQPYVIVNRDAWKSAIDELGMSEVEVSIKAFGDRTYIGRILRKQKYVRLDTFRKLCDVVPGIESGAKTISYKEYRSAVKEMRSANKSKKRTKLLNDQAKTYDEIWNMKVPVPMEDIIAVCRHRWSGFTGWESLAMQLYNWQSKGPNGKQKKVKDFVYTKEYYNAGASAAAAKNGFELGTNNPYAVEDSKLREAWDAEREKTAALSANYRKVKDERDELAKELEEMKAKEETLCKNFRQIGETLEEMQKEEEPEYRVQYLEKRPHRVQLVMEPTLYNEAKEQAEKLGTSFNDYVHRALDNYANREATSESKAEKKPWWKRIFG